MCIRDRHHTWAAPDPAKPQETGWRTKAARTFGVTSIPTMVLIGADGKILKRGHLTAAEIEGEIVRLTGGSPTADKPAEAK